MLVKRLGLYGADTKIETNGKVNFNVFEFADQEAGFWTNIKCNDDDEVVAIPEDYSIKVGSNWSITNNWSIWEAKLKGKTVEHSIYKIFQDADPNAFKYGPEHFLDELIDECFEDHADHFNASLKDLQNQVGDEGVSEGGGEEDGDAEGSVVTRIMGLL